MGANAQQILQSDPEYLRRQLQAQEAQRVNPTGSAAGALGALLGRGISNVSQGKGFFESPDYGLKRVSGVQGIMQSVQFDPKNPAKYYQEVGAALQQSGYGDLAPLAFQEARKLSVQDTEIGLKEREVKAREKSAEAAAGFDALNIITKDGRLVRMNKATGKVQVEDKDTGQTRDFDPRKDVLEYKTTEDPLKAMMAMMLMGAMPAKPPSSASQKSSDSKPKPSKPLNPADYTAP